MPWAGQATDWAPMHMDLRSAPKRNLGNTRVETSRNAAKTLHRLSKRQHTPPPLAGYSVGCDNGMSATGPAYQMLSAGACRTRDSNPPFPKDDIPRRSFVPPCAQYYSDEGSERIQMG